MKCPKCQFDNPEGFEFCGKCGHRLEETLEKAVPRTESERKYVTVLFSDLSGYTALSEKLDPEEVKEITSQLFGQISEVIAKYEGFVEKFVGDAVMALFGVPKAHEDDPIRAIRAAREIHELVDSMSPELEKSIGQPISMHTGINTGLVVTGEVDMEKGTHGVAGDTINLASRLSSLAETGDILVSPETYRGSEGHFEFQPLEPTTVKGKAEPVQMHKVLSPKKKPITLHRLSGLRADLIGRKMEMAQLGEAIKNLREGKGRIFSICGEAGTGKSRLVEEFKASLDLNEIQWLEGHAYAYSQNIPYFPLMDLLNRVFQIEEADPSDKIRKRIESGIEHLLGKADDAAPYVGGLYSLRYPEVEDVSPEFWKSQLQDAIKKILSALAQKAPTVFFLEDLHWADPSFIDLLRNALLQVPHPAIVVCVYRPTFSLFTTNQISSIAKIYHEIRLQDLSSFEAQDMLESLLKTETIPSDLRSFVRDKAEGNPFYLEELVNSLIESETLIRDNGSWAVAKPISEADISSTIHGVISGRLDRLENETKRILQEASVIGRAFLYEILKRITELKQDIDQSLRDLEHLDLIRTKSFEPDLEYVFKHVLTQEVVYNGLLKKERKEIHERIGVVMEHLFQDRLPEFYETLAFHFTQGESLHKAVDYLMKSGEKSLIRYAVEESYQYYQQAYKLLIDKSEQTNEERALLFDLLNKWSLVYYYLGNFKEWTELLRSHEAEAGMVEDKEKSGMFYAWLGFNLLFRWELKKSYTYLRKALELGEAIENGLIIGYACTWLTWTCAELDKYDEAVFFGERALELAPFFKSDQYLFFKSWGGFGHNNLYKGEGKGNFEIAERLLDYGKRHSNIRCLVMANICQGYGHFALGNFPSAINCFKEAIEISADPFYTEWPKLMLSVSYLLNGQVDEAEEAAWEIDSYIQNFGCEAFGTFAYSTLAIASISKGRMAKGMRMLQDFQRAVLEKDDKWGMSFMEYLLGKVYLQVVEGAGPVNISIIVRNIGFLIKSIPFASKKAENHFKNAIEVAEEIGAKGILGLAFFDLGLLHKAKKKIDGAKECLSQAIRIFEQCEAEVYLKQAKDALASLG